MNAGLPAAWTPAALIRYRGKAAPGPGRLTCLGIKGRRQQRNRLQWARRRDDHQRGDTGSAIDKTIATATWRLARMVTSAAGPQASIPSRPMQRPMSPLASSRSRCVQACYPAPLGCAFSGGRPPGASCLCPHLRASDGCLPRVHVSRLICAPYAALEQLFTMVASHTSLLKPD